MYWKGLAVFENQATDEGGLWNRGTESFTFGANMRLTAEHNSNMVLGTVDYLWRVGNEIWAHGEIKNEKLFFEKYNAGTVGLSIQEAPDDLTIKIKDDQIRETENGLEITLGGTELRTKSAKIRDISLVGIPAHEATRITEISEQPFPEGQEIYRLVASGGRIAKLPADHFKKINFTEPTALIATDDGEVYGHVGIWGTEHNGAPGQPDFRFSRRILGDISKCQSHTTYLDDDTIVFTGVLVGDIAHAGDHDIRLSTEEIIESLQSDTRNQAAKLRIWKDQFGLAVHGSMLPDVTPGQAARIFSSPPSVDLRGGREGNFLGGIWAVNWQGYDQAKALPSASPYRLVASGNIQIPEEDIIHKDVKPVAEANKQHAGETDNGSGQPVSAKKYLEAQAEAVKNTVRLLLDK